MGIEWTREALDALATGIYGERQTYEPDKLRAALDAACEVQGLETIGYRASQKSFDSGQKIGRVEALEEAALESEKWNDGVYAAERIRALKNK